MAKTVSKWLEGASYKLDRRAILPHLTLLLPNSATTTKIRYRGRAQCDIVQCILDELGIPGETLA